MFILAETLSNYVEHSQYVQPLLTIRAKMFLLRFTNARILFGRLSPVEAERGGESQSRIDLREQLPWWWNLLQTDTEDVEGSNKVETNGHKKTIKDRAFFLHTCEENRDVVDTSNGTDEGKGQRHKPRTRKNLNSTRGMRPTVRKH